MDSRPSIRNTEEIWTVYSGTNDGLEARVGIEPSPSERRSDQKELAAKTQHVTLPLGMGNRNSP
jgi:hypothetical protein